MVHQLNGLDQWACVLIAGKNGLYLEVPLQSMAHHSWHFNYAYAHEHIFHHLLSNLNRRFNSPEFNPNMSWWWHDVATTLVGPTPADFFIFKFISTYIWNMWTRSDLIINTVRVPPLIGHSPKIAQIGPSIWFKGSSIIQWIRFEDLYDLFHFIGLIDERFRSHP